MALKPLTHPDDLYRLLREGKVNEFNQRKTQMERVKLNGWNFRHLDLRGLDAHTVDLGSCYFHNADLRGVDLSQASLEGASFNGARISGVLFPRISPPKRSSCRSPMERACATRNDPRPARPGLQRLRTQPRRAIGNQAFLSSEMRQMEARV